MYLGTSWEIKTEIRAEIIPFIEFSKKVLKI